MRCFSVGACLAAIAVAFFALSCREGVGPASGPVWITVAGGGSTDTVDARRTVVVRISLLHRLPAGIDVVTFRPVHTNNTTVPRTLRISQFVDTTDADGVASVMVLFGPLAGTGYLEIRIQGVEWSDTLEFTTLPGAPDAMSVSPRDTPVVVGGSYEIRAQLMDRYANALPGTPTFGTASPSIQLSGSGTVQGISVGRAKAAIQIGPFADSAFASVVPPGTLAVWDYGRFVGDSAGYTQVDLDGSHVRRLFNTGLTPIEYAPGNALAPRWIPGTRQIVYPRNVDGASRLFVGDSTGVSRRLVAQPGAIAWEADPEVSPDGVWVYFVARDSGDALYRIPVAGGTPEELLRATGGGGLRSPSLSPDGKALVYVSSSFAGDMFRAYILDLTTGTTRRLTPNEAAGPRWSPTNEWIVYAVSGPWGGYSGHIRLVHPDGSDDHDLIDGAYFPGGSWSPDGKYVILIRAEIGTGWELLDVGQGTRLPLSYRHAWYGPAWRP